jgi:hypothetical protein
MPKAQGGRDDFLDIFQISFVTGFLWGGGTFHMGQNDHSEAGFDGIKKPRLETGGA